MPYTVTSTTLPEVLILTPKIYEDERGSFFESFNARDFEGATGLKRDFVQDNQSRSAQGVLRGMHYQVQHPQEKLVRVLSGEVFDVVVDLRRNSPRFGKWASVILSEKNKAQLWIPEGFAHGFLVISQGAEFFYKTTEYWYSDCERVLLWNDAALGINWPFVPTLQLSARDSKGKTLVDAERFV